MFCIPRLLQKLSLLLAAMALCGGQWAVLQIVAWTGMAINYSSTYGVREGLTKTFDGSAPCAMCKKITQAKKTERSENAMVPTKAAKIEAIAETGLSIASDPFSISDPIHWPDYTNIFLTRSERPLFPPPRSA